MSDKRYLESSGSRKRAGLSTGGARILVEAGMKALFACRFNPAGGLLLSLEQLVKAAPASSSALDPSAALPTRTPAIPVPLPLVQVV